MNENKVSVGKDSVKLTIYRILTMVIAMVSTMLLSRFRSLGEYATYSQLTLIIRLVTTLFTLGLPYSISYFLSRAETPADRRKFLSTYYTLVIVLNAIVGLVLVFCIPFIENFFGNDMISEFAYFLAIFPWCSIVIHGVDHVLIVYKKSNLIMAYRIANSLTLLGVIFLTKIAGWTFSTYMILYTAGEVFFSILVYVIVIKIAGGYNLLLDLQFVKRILKYSIPVGLASTVSVLNVEIDKLLVGNRFSSDEMAIYTNASKEMPLHVIVIAVSAVVMPPITRMIKEAKVKEAVDLWKEVCEFVFIILCFFSCMLIAYAKQVMYVLYDIKYLPGAPIFAVYSLLIMIHFTYFNMMLNASGKTKFVLYSSIMTVILNSVLNLLFIELFGIIGPAIASVVSAILMAVVQLVFTSRVLKVKFSQIMPWKKFAKILVVCASFGVIGYFALQCISKWFPYHLFGITSGVGVDTIIAIFLGVILMLVYFVVFSKRMKTIWKKIK